MDSKDDKHIDHAAELDDCYLPDAEGADNAALERGDGAQSEKTPPPKTAEPDERPSEDGRQAYLRKLASGELNRIDEVD